MTGALAVALQSVNFTRGQGQSEEEEGEEEREQLEGVAHSVGEGEAAERNTGEVAAVAVAVAMDTTTEAETSAEAPPPGHPFALIPMLGHPQWLLLTSICHNRICHGSRATAFLPSRRTTKATMTRPLRAAMGLLAWRCHPTY